MPDNQSRRLPPRSLTTTMYDEMHGGHLACCVLSDARGGGNIFLMENGVVIIHKGPGDYLEISPQPDGVRLRASDRQILVAGEYRNQVLFELRRFR